MTRVMARDISYDDRGVTCRGWFCAPAGVVQGGYPGVFVVHGAHGLNDHVVAAVEDLAGLGYAVLALDLWGGRRTPRGPEEFGPLLQEFARDRAAWQRRMAAGVAALVAQPEVQRDRIAGVGYCFGGASVLEYLRLGGHARAVISLHGGLDLVGDDWSGAGAGADSGRVLICSGAEDPMAGAEDLARLRTGLNGAGLRWEIDLYGQARHAFTETDHPETPPFAGYDAFADARSWAAMRDFLAGAFLG